MASIKEQQVVKNNPFPSFPWTTKTHRFWKHGSIAEIVTSGLYLKNLVPLELFHIPFLLYYLNEKQWAHSQIMHFFYFEATHIGQY